ncbi:4Fe-4S dicluster domain-containing protein [Youxingia wuxianensis]|uniref:4Fe-4S dicluster domain-containing protein n=1 Tax=Youxingia wuxianensis TaxID=2763678 RepID=A0A926EMB2_9FIRM|nr:4Fe-4S dicluster domain-containing protein [Youxingia wuxianensis]MBC8584990.1 4Fe-4S dicluster domain-containing protein [Youxingia wuxianensis]
MRNFDTNVQLLKYNVLKGVAKHAYEGTLRECYHDIPIEIIPGPEPTMRCCIYKERAIVSERIKLAMGGDKNNPNVIEVLNIACDECPVNRYTVGEACRGCIAHRCQHVCPVGAIEVHGTKAHINPDKCIECGRCASVCPYSAIIKSVRPCENACKINAIKMNDEKKAQIDNEKCISCGACVYQCPFGAIVDKSFILDAINILKESQDNKKYRVYAVIAPSISSQFAYAKIGQVVTGLKHLGFHSVVEAALGADMVAYQEALELKEKGFLTSSCCPAFVQYIKTAFPKMVEHISHNPSPMVAIAQFIKKLDPGAKTIFIGPCTAKKMEFQQEPTHAIDCVITFEELQALLDCRDITIENLEEGVLDNASYYGRIFARSGGLSDAVAQALKEHGITPQEFEAKPVACDGIEQCKIALLKAGKNMLDANFIEGMACVGGCIGGAACITHGPKDKNEVNKYGELAKEKTISDAVAITRM